MGGCVCVCGGVVYIPKKGGGLGPTWAVVPGKNTVYMAGTHCTSWNLLLRCKSDIVLTARSIK